MIKKTDGTVLQKLRKEKKRKFTKKMFQNVVGVCVEKEEPKLSEKETLEFVRMDLKTAMHRLEEVSKSMQDLMHRGNFLLNAASFEIKRAGEGLK